MNMRDRVDLVCNKFLGACVYDGGSVRVVKPTKGSSICIYIFDACAFVRNMWGDVIYFDKPYGLETQYIANQAIRKFQLMGIEVRKAVLDDYLGTFVTKGYVDDVQ